VRNPILDGNLPLSFVPEKFILLILVRKPKEDGILPCTSRPHIPKDSSVDRAPILVGIEPETPPREMAVTCPDVHDMPLKVQISERGWL